MKTASAKLFHEFCSLLKKEQNYLVLIFSLFSVLVFLTWHTPCLWNYYDHQRELMDPYFISKGLVLYRDVYYFYGPLVPYILAVFVKLLGFKQIYFHLFGVSLIFIYSYLLYAISRLFMLSFPSMLVSLLFLLQLSFLQYSVYIYPYSYGAVVGSILTALLVYVLLLHLKTKNSFLLYFASAILSLGFLNKQDFALSCVGIFLVYFLVLPFFSFQYHSKQSVYSQWKSYYSFFNLKTLFLCLFIIAFLPSIFYLYLLKLAGFDTLYHSLLAIDHLNSSSCFLFDFNTNLSVKSLLGFLLLGVGSFIITGFFIYIISLLCKYADLISNRLKLTKRRFFVLLLLMLAVILIYSLFTNEYLLSLFVLLLRSVYKSINLWFIVLLFIIVFKKKETRDLSLIFLIIAAFLSNYRMFLSLEIKLYAFFYLPLALILYVYILYQILPEYLAPGLKIDHALFRSSALVFIVFVSFVYLFYNILIYSAPVHQVKSPIGKSYFNLEMEKEKFALTVQASEYIKRHSTAEDKILAHPYLGLTYAFTNRLPAHMFYYFPPGIFYTKELETTFVNDIASFRPDFILLSSDFYYNPFMEPWGYNLFTSGSFELSYPDWVKKNYKLEKTFMTDVQLNGKKWSIEIYAKE